MSARRILPPIVIATALAVASASAEAPPSFLFKWGSPGSGDAEFNHPVGIGQDGNGILYVADQANMRIQWFTPQGDHAGQWSTLSDGLWDVAVGPGGAVYVLLKNEVRKYSDTGALLTRWGSTGPGDGQFADDPGGIAVDARGNVYVCDTWNHRVQKFDAEGTFLLAWGVAGRGDGQFKAPQDVAVDENGDVYVTDGNNRRVEKFSTSGKFQRRWGLAGTGEGQFSSYLRVTCDRAGRVYVADCQNARVQAFDLNGRFLTAWGSRGAGDGEFSGNPLDPCATAAGRIYVADAGQNRIQAFGRAEVPAPVGLNVEIAIPGTWITPPRLSMGRARR